MRTLILLSVLVFAFGCETDQRTTQSVNVEVESVCTESHDCVTIVYECELECECDNSHSHGNGHGHGGN